MIIRVANYSQIVQQIADLRARLAPARFTEAIREARMEIARQGLRWISQYPPETSSNMPGNYPKRWYSRGSGPVWALKGGGVHFRRTSEKLGTKWAVTDQGAVGAAITNIASYAAFVQADATQARIHRQHGWRTDTSLIEWLKESGTALQIMRAAVEKLLDWRKAA